jgi:hypothetical protein
MQRITNRNRTRLVVALVIGLCVATLGATCQGAYNTAVVTATNLDNQFATTGAAMDGLVRTQKITFDQYKPWADFANKYKPLSDSAYRALKASKDAKTVTQATAVINQLESEIAMYLIYAQGK